MNPYEFEYPNALIAEFMGYEIKSRPAPHRPSGIYWLYLKEKDKKNTYWAAVDFDLQYDKDWNLLMPVVEKIESLGFDFDIDGSCCEIVLERNPHHLIYISKIKGKKKAIYEAIQQFLEWYKKNK